MCSAFCGWIEVGSLAHGTGDSNNDRNIDAALWIVLVGLYNVVYILWSCSFYNILVYMYYSTIVGPAVRRLSAPQRSCLFYCGYSARVAGNRGTSTCGRCCQLSRAGPESDCLLCGVSLKGRILKLWRCLGSETQHFRGKTWNHGLMQSKAKLTRRGSCRVG